MTPGWLNDNNNRDYPFQTVADVPMDLIVDIGIILGPFEDRDSWADSTLLSDFDMAVDDVYLKSVERVGGEITLKFGMTADFITTDLVFVIPVDTPDYTTLYANAFRYGTLLWQGWLVIGERVKTSASLDIDAFQEYTDSKVEKALVQNMSRRFVDSLNVANTPRLKVDEPADCVEEVSVTSSDGSATPADEAIVHATNIAGHVKFREGFNCTIRQEAGTNSIVISGVFGAGGGTPCTEIPMTVYEESSSFLDQLSGGPTCSEVLQSLNGVGGENINITVGEGFSVRQSTTDLHTLIISPNPTAFAVCIDEGSSA